MTPKAVEGTDSSSGISQSSSATDDATVKTADGDSGLIYTVENGTTWKVNSTDDDSTSADTPRLYTRIGFPSNFRGKELTKKVKGGTVYVDVYSVYHNSPDPNVQADTADYLAGGVWFFVPEGSTTPSAYEYGAFVSGSEPFESKSTVGTLGEATYTGPATGQFLEEESGDIGYIDGRVSLTADFVGSSISGKISGIRKDGGSPLSGELALSSNSLALDVLFTGSVTGTVGGDEYTGNWGGQFFGTREVDDGDGGEPERIYPGSVGGTFGATTGNGKKTFVGIFGTTTFEEKKDTMTTQ